METLTKIIEALGAKLIEAEALLMEINVILFVAMSACGVLIGALVGYATIVSVLLR